MRRSTSLGIGSLGTTLAVVPLLGCARVSDRDDRFTLPAQWMEIVATVPPDGAMGVDPGASIDLCWSALLDPRSVGVTAATVSSGAARFDSALALQLVPWRGPGSEPLDLTAPWCPGSVVSITPNAPLIEGVRFRLTFAATAVGWHGERIDTTTPGWVHTDGGAAFYSLEFVVAGEPRGTPPQQDHGTAATSDVEGGTDADAGTGSGNATDAGLGSAIDTETDTTAGLGSALETDTDAGQDTDSGTDASPSAPPSVTLRDLFGPGRVFDPQREICGCHRDPLDRAHQLLDLTTVDTAFGDLVAPTRLRDTGFPMVTPRHPSESFLLHKVLREPRGEALAGVRGEAMPPGGPLPYPDLVDLARWIEAGAPR